MEQGIKAEAEENVEEAKKSYEAAISAYAEIRQKHPTASPELVIEHQEECHRRLHALWADDPLSDDNAEQKRREFLAALPPEISEGELPRNQVSLPRAASPESPGENLVEHTDAPAPTSSEAPPASASLSDRVEFVLREEGALDRAGERAWAAHLSQAGLP